jgi:tripartite-type tricarboxylate transporter receptor subunit TctC
MFGKANCPVDSLKNAMTHHSLLNSLKHRARLRLTVAVCLAGLSLGMAHAQSAVGSSAANAYPTGSVTLLVPFTTGTGADLLARLLGPKLADKWKVSVVTDNKAGASGSIGTGIAAKSAPNGLTVLITATAHGTFPALMPKLPFNPQQAFTPVVLLSTSALGVATSGKSPLNTFKDFQESAKKQPGVLNYSSPGTGSPQHLAMELLAQETGIKLLHVPYKGTSGALTDLMGGHVQASVVALQTAAPHLQSGALRMLALMSAERSPAFPNVPTLKELGIQNGVVETWYGVFVPAGTPPEVVAKLNADFNSLLQLPDVKDTMNKQGMVVVGGKPDRMGDLAKNELTRWARVVEKAGITGDN